LVEHLVAGGATTNRSEDEIQKIVDSFGGATNAYTSTSRTSYFIDCAAKHTMTCIDIVADQMQHAAFEPAAFAREHEVVQRELADGLIDRRRQGWRLLSATLYPDHPAGVPVIGYRDVLRQITRQDCIDFYKSRYVPNNQIFVVVGDVETEPVMKKIAECYAGTPRAYETYIPFQPCREQETPRLAVKEMDGTTYDLLFAWPTVKLSSRDMYALDVASYILAHGESSRLVQSLKYDKQLVLSINTASHTPFDVKGMFAVMAGCRPDTWEQASEAIVKEVYRLRDELVGEKELAKAKKQKAAELVFGQQTVQSAAENLAWNYQGTNDPLFDDTYVANIQKVTAEEVRDVARRYFTPDRLNRIVICPPGGAPKVEDEASGGKDGEVHSKKLPNGVRLLVKRQANLPLVNIQAFVIGGSLIDTEKTAGQSALVGAMLDKGTSEMTAVEIADFFDSIGGKFGTISGRNSIGTSATVLADDLERATEVLADCMLRPTFPEDEFKKIQHLALGAIAQRANVARMQVLEAFLDALPAGSPYHLMQGGKKETVERLTAEDLTKCHAKYFTGPNMVVSVFGDVDPEETMKLLTRLFGEVSSKPVEPPVTFDRPNALPKTEVLHETIQKETGMVVIGFPCASILDKKDYAALTVLNTILSGYQMPGGWLHKELRGEGLVYWVSGFQLSGPAPGYFTFMAQTQPDKVDEVAERILKNIQKAKDGKIEKEEFDTAIQTIIEMHAQSETTIGERARRASLDDLYGLGYDYDKSFDERIKAVTVDDVVGVAKKYLNDYLQLTASPEKK
jgi:zinc protease